MSKCNYLGILPKKLLQRARGLNYVFNNVQSLFCGKYMGSVHTLYTVRFVVVSVTLKHQYLVPRVFSSVCFHFTVCVRGVQCSVQLN